MPELAKNSETELLSELVFPVKKCVLVLLLHIIKANKINKHSFLSIFPLICCRNLVKKTHMHRKN